jgi:hypothetical protein
MRVAGPWLYSAGGAVGVALALLIISAGLPLVGLFLGVIVWLSARAAVAPEERRRMDNHLRRACNRLPFCDCRAGERE